MERQELLNSICTLQGAIDTLIRAGAKNELKIAIEKLLDLIKLL